MNQAWCPSCREWTVLDVGRPCAWCDTPLVAKRGGWKRPDLTGRITEARARALHAVYTEKKVSVRTLSDHVWKQLGYSSPAACREGIYNAFRRWGLPRRERIYAVKLASTTSGLSPRDDKLRRARRKAAGLNIHGKPLRPRCAAVRAHYPRKGQRCQRPAMHGSDYCASHDPLRAEERNRHLERARARRAA